MLPRGSKKIFAPPPTQMLSYAPDPQVTLTAKLQLKNSIFKQEKIWISHLSLNRLRYCVDQMA